jgi:hypothetical protein
MPDTVESLRAKLKKMTKSRDVWKGRAMYSAQLACNLLIAIKGNKVGSNLEEVLNTLKEYDGGDDEELK